LPNHSVLELKLKLKDGEGEILYANKYLKSSNTDLQILSKYPIYFTFIPEFLNSIGKRK